MLFFFIFTLFFVCVVVNVATWFLTTALSLQGEPFLTKWTA